MYIQTRHSVDFKRLLQPLAVVEMQHIEVDLRRMDQNQSKINEKTVESQSKIDRKSHMCRAHRTCVK